MMLDYSAEYYDTKNTGLEACKWYQLKTILKKLRCDREYIVYDVQGQRSHVVELGRGTKIGRQWTNDGYHFCGDDVPEWDEENLFVMLLPEFASPT